MPVIDPLVLVRGLHFAATLLAAGTMSFIVLVAAPLLRAGEATALARRLTLLVWTALVAAVVTGLAWLGLVAANILGVPLAGLWHDGGLWTVVAETRFGLVACQRLGLALVLAVLMALPQRPGVRPLQLAAAALLAGLLSLVGHAGATPGAAGWLHLSSDLLHVLAAAAWLGGLPAFAMTLGATHRPLGRSNYAGAAEVTAKFSMIGIVCVGVLFVSGSINSWELLGSPAELWSTTYGRVLAIKIVLFAGMVAVAANNRIRLTPRLPAENALRGLQRNSLIETALGFAVLLLVGALGNMIPGGHVHANNAPPPSESAFVHIHTEAVMADVTIDPGHAGKNTVAIRLWREDFSDYPVSDVKLVLEPRDGGPLTRERNAIHSLDGTWQIDAVDIPHAGVWIVRLTLGQPGARPVILDAPIVIMQCSNECW